MIIPSIAASTVWEILHAAGYRSGASQGRADLAAVRDRSGPLDRCLRFPGGRDGAAQPLYVLVLIEHGTRRLHLAGVSYIATQPARDVTDLNDLRSIHRKPVVTGVINEYHHAA
jgi:hypothetical protein